MPSAAAARSSTTGVPPGAAMAPATAAPSPEAPPVTRTVPSALAVAVGASSAVSGDGTDRRLLDESGRGMAVEVGQQHDRTAPALDDLRLGQVGAAVVAALDPDVRSQPLQRPYRRVLVEDQHRVDTAQRAQHRGAVARADERPAGALQPPYGVVGVQAHDEAVAEAARGLERADVADVEQIKATAGG